MATYEIWLATRGGALQKPLYDFVNLTASLKTNGVGFVNLTLPGTAYNLSDFPHRYRLLIKRNGALLGKSAYYITGKSLQLSEGGEYILSVTAAHSNRLLSDRHIMYYAGQTQAVASAEEADNLMKRLIRYNLGANAADGNRDKAAPVSVVSVASDTTEGPQISKGFARRNLLTVLQEISQAAREAGTPVYFGLIDDSGIGTPRFITKINQWGSDKSALVTVTPESGNLTGASRMIDFNEFASVAYSLGQGTGASRAIGESEDTTATNASNLLFVEKTIQANNVSGAAGLADEADSLLRSKRASSGMNGTIQETNSFLYNVHWALGDKISAEFNGETFTGLINSVAINVSDGKETITGTLEIDNILAGGNPLAQLVSRVTQLETNIDRNASVEN